MGYSLGIGLTNNCNLSCAHCYRDTQRVDNITLKQIKQICTAVDIDAVGMGTGENVMNPEFIQIVDYLSKRGIKLSMASNGFSLTSPTISYRFFTTWKFRLTSPHKPNRTPSAGQETGLSFTRQLSAARNMGLKSQSWLHS
jgi:organic radical activating enzyme